MALKNSDLHIDPDQTQDGVCGEHIMFPKWFGQAVCTVLFVAMDILFYGSVIPLIGVYVGGKFLTFVDLNFGPIWETVVAVAVVFILMSVILKGKQEEFFWKHFLPGIMEFKKILMIRDVMNTVTMLYLVSKLLRVVRNIIRSHGITSRNLHEGVVYVTLSTFLPDDVLEKQFGIQPSYHENYCNPVLEGWVPDWMQNLDGESAAMIPPEESWLLFKRMVDSIFDVFYGATDPIKPDNLQIFHLIQLRKHAIYGAELILTVSQLTAGVTKLMYFTSLFSYERAMNIFLAMQRDGEFDDDEDTREILSAETLGLSSEKKESIVEDGRTNYGIENAGLPQKSVPPTIKSPADFQQFPKYPHNPRP